jgi:hypothetical protein
MRENGVVGGMKDLAPIIAGIIFLVLLGIAIATEIGRLVALWKYILS